MYPHTSGMRQIRKVAILQGRTAEKYPTAEHAEGALHAYKLLIMKIVSLFCYKIYHLFFWSDIKYRQKTVIFRVHSLAMMVAPDSRQRRKYACHDYSLNSLLILHWLAFKQKTVPDLIFEGPETKCIDLVRCVSGHIKGAFLSILMLLFQSG